MNDQDLPNDDIDWIYSSKKLKKLSSMRNPLDEKLNISDIKPSHTPDSVFDRKDPVFDEPSSPSVHSKLQNSLEQKVSLNLDGNKLEATKRLHTGKTDTVTKMAEGTATKDDLQAVLHNYDPFCNCNRCSDYFSR